ncbi:MAG: NAD-dependent epimerase/dehydratase family protein [Marinobacter sp.]|uniref:NAD-dependent epimerase/dehydratase family protein n=1 Tax=Marinobacter sp. TaxID=50741 RepID=UPI0034A07765
MAITEHRNRPCILVAGCGSLGGVIAHTLCENAEVYGLRRNADAIKAPVLPIGADLLEPAELASAIPANVDALIYCLTPSSYDDAGYQAAYVTGLKNLLAVLGSENLSRVIFISSTSVYHQDDDGWVDENSPTVPAKFSGQRILEGESVALNCGIPATIIRFSGIYGPSRHRFLAAVRRGEMNPLNPAPYTNRIHEVDAANAVVHLMQASLRGEALAEHYIASDCEPARLAEVVAWVQNQTHCAQPKSGARAGGRAGSKRCRNQRLLDSGFSFRYPDYRTGYSEMIEQIT